MRFLDYQKVKDVERRQASDLFGTWTQPSATASEILGKKSSRTFDVSAAAAANGGRTGPTAQQGDKAVRVKLTDKERKNVEKMIREARSLQEIARLEKELNEGRIPAGAMVDDDNNDVQMT